MAQRALDLVWEHLLPAFTAQRIPEVTTGLAETLVSPTRPTVVGEPSSPTAGRVAGIRFAFDGSVVTAATFEPGLLTIVRGDVGTPFSRTVTLEFRDDTLTLDDT